MRVPPRKSLLRTPLAVLVTVLATLSVAARRHRSGRPRRRARGRHALGGHRRRLLHLRRGRPLGRQHQRRPRDADALGADGVLRQRRQHRRADRPLPPQQGRRDLHRRRRQRPQPRLLGRGDDDVTDATATSSPASTSTTTAPATTARRKMLQQFAATHNVKMVVVSIGGNDFEFAVDRRAVRHRLPGLAVVVAGLLQGRRRRSPRTSPPRTSRRAGAGSRPPPQRPQAMRDAGYADAAWTLLVQTYPSPIPHGSGFRYASPATPGRTPAAAASGTPTPTGPTTPRCRRSTAPSPARSARPASPTPDARPRDGLQRPAALREHRRALRGGGPDLLDPARRRRPDRVGQPDPHRDDRGVQPYYIQESLHPNYWAQLATRSCVRQAYNGGAPRGGTCTIAGTGLVDGEPRMRQNRGMAAQR